MRRVRWQRAASVLETRKAAQKALFCALYKGKARRRETTGSVPNLGGGFNGSVLRQ